MRRPYLKWFVSDWRGDPRLRMCSLAARGLWADMLTYMHEGEPYGHLTINGRAPKLDEIANLVGRPEREVEKAFGELVRYQVFSMADGIMYSRRMVRDEEKARAGAAEALKKWGDGESPGASRSQRIATARRKGTHTSEEWDAMIEALGCTCSRCGSTDRIVKDHIIPIYQGGSDSIDNLQPLCQSCNASKGPDATDLRHYEWKKRLGECLARRLGEEQKTPAMTSAYSPDTRKKKQNKNSVSMGTRISENWVAAVDEVDFARQQGLPDSTIAEVEAAFRDYWKGRAGSGGRKADWPATWRNWVRNHCNRSINGPSSGMLPRPGSREDRQEKTANAYAKLREYARSGANVEGKSDDASDPPFGLLPFVKPPRS